MREAFSMEIMLLLFQLHVKREHTYPLGLFNFFPCIVQTIRCDSELGVREHEAKMSCF
jgi:hypothetical protein